MAEIMKMADEVIDTSALSISQLKERLGRKVLKSRAPRMQVVLVSFGYKYGLPLDSDLVFDTRFLPNPFYVDRLRRPERADAESSGITSSARRRRRPSSGSFSLSSTGSSRSSSRKARAP